MIKIRTRKSKIISIFFGILFLVIINSNNFGYSPLTNDNIYENNETNLKIAGYWIVSPFTIDGNSGWGTAKSTYDWITGSGSWIDPYIIENITIDAEYSGSCIEIRNSDVYFIIRNCTLSNAGAEDTNAGIYLNDVRNGLITSNNCSNNIRDGMWIMGRNNTIDGNYASYNIGFGISIRDDYNRIINNYIVNNIGVALLIFSDYNIIDNNTIKSNRDGMDIHACNYNNITNNIIEDSRDFHSGSNGIALFMSNNNLILNNTISRNELWGIFLSGSSNNNFIIGNRITNNSGAGIYLMDNLFNIIFNNSFIMNSPNGYDDGNLNQWDNGIIGNYWNDYGGVDADDDGIGDSAYDISGSAGSKDNYPIWDDGFNGNPILIDGQASGVGAHNWTWAESKTWCSGSGTWSAPYIIENLTIDGLWSGSCIEIKNSDVYFIVRNCTLYHGGYEFADAGIFLNNVRNGLITSNNCSENLMDGIHLVENSDNNTISMNLVMNNGYSGIFINTVSENLISKNTASENNFYDINLQGNGNTISENIMSDFYMRMLSSHNNTIVSNYINNSRIELLLSNENIFWNNTLIGNSQISLSDTCYLNLVYQNYFKDTSRGVDNGNPVLNRWDNGTIGNYWANYDGVDINDDGIGDTPYNIQGAAGSQDNYPLWEDMYSSPIFIDGSAAGVGAHNWTWAKSKTWCSGSGTFIDPYIIENLNIDGGWSGSCIEIRNSEVYFIIRNCTLYNSGFSEAGIYLYYVKNGMIIINDCSNNGKNGIEIEWSNNNTIAGNSLNNNIVNGISLDTSHNNSILNNTAFNSEYGIHIKGNYNNISKNIVFDNNYGIQIINQENIVSENIVTSNEYYGIEIRDSYNTILNNTANNNGGDGIAIGWSDSGCKILGNIAYNNRNGISLLYSNNHTISGNDVKNSSNRGINLDESHINKVWNNYISESGWGNGYDNGLSNQWDNGTIGNYWDDYGGLDANDDGIGDTPYNIQGSAGNQDNFPIWWDAPIINITIPYEDNIFEIPPNFEISIIEGITNTTWYTLDNGITNFTFSGLSGIINQAEWYNKPNGQISIIFYANDSRGYVDSSEVTVIKNVDIPQITIITPITDQLIGNNSPEFELIINDQSPILFTWYTIDNGLNNYTFIGLTGTINQTAWDYQEDGTITIQFYAQDSIGNIGTNQVIVRKDTENPTWIEPPTDQVAEFGDVFSYDLNATDTSGISYWWVNDTVTFSIDNTTGVITNNTMLDIGIYWLEVRAYDPLGHNCSAPFKLIVQDTTAPTWVITPEDQIIELGESMYYDLDAYDLSNIGSWEINDTTYFSIDSNGIITNITELEVRVYYLEVRVYDAYGNNISAPIIITVQDSTAPTITINTPNTNELFGIIAPIFNIEIYDLNLDTMWYTLDNGLTNTTFTTNGTINQALWSALPDGNVIIRFYANDSVGNIGFAEVTIRKDVTAPIITINNPQNSDVIGTTAPNFEISIDELNLDKTWYSINGGNNITFTGLTGTINQVFWDLLPEGNVIIRFYANDTLGRIGFQEVTVVKEISQPSPPGIPGYNILLLLGIVSTIAVIIVKKRLNRLN